MRHEILCRSLCEADQLARKICLPQINHLIAAVSVSEYSYHSSGGARRVVLRWSGQPIVYLSPCLILPSRHGLYQKLLVIDRYIYPCNSSGFNCVRFRATLKHKLWSKVMQTAKEKPPGAGWMVELVWHVAPRMWDTNLGLSDRAGEMACDSFISISIGLSLLVVQIWQVDDHDLRS